MRVIKIHTDGGCRGNQYDNNIGGIGIVARSFIDGKHVSTAVHKKGFSTTTNNRMELIAVISAIKMCQSHVDDGVFIEIYSDSNIVIKGMNEWIDGWIKRGWKKSNKKPVENQDLWKELYKLSDGKVITFSKTKGHADDEWNNLADKLVNEAMDEFTTQNTSVKYNK